MLGKGSGGGRSPAEASRKSRRRRRRRCSSTRCQTSPLAHGRDALRLWPCYAGGSAWSSDKATRRRDSNMKPLVLPLLDDRERVVAERRLVCMTGWDVVADDWKGTSATSASTAARRRSTRSAAARAGITSSRTPASARTSSNAASTRVRSSCVGRASKTSNRSCATARAYRGVRCAAHDPAAQKDYCETLQRIVGDLFRTDLVEVTVATDLLALAEPVDLSSMQRALREGSLKTLSSFCDETGARLPICAVVSVIPGKDAARAAKICGRADGTVLKECSW